MSRPLITATIILLILTTQAAAAPIYKWVDSENRVHYEDTRPPTGDVEVIAAPVIYRGETQDKTTPKAPVNETVAGNAEREKMCAQSKERLAEAQSAERMYTLDEKGNRTYMTTQEIAAHVVKLQEAVDSWCN